ncbi:MAG: SipW-dependent-type signal peptide-containing protein [Dehalococcoidales bacterium]|nr:SipW-dependent-type signal peptide-containing protein [Dehalococcoidales bacterium]
MKNVLLSVVVVGTLIAAGIGGTFADFSDIEKSENNSFEVGALDLRVSVNDVEYDDPNVPTIIDASGAFPCCSKDAVFDVHNTGEGQGTGYLYIHLKDLECYEVPNTKHPTGRTEPEDVAENGGWVGNVWVDGIGPLGADCTLGDYIEVFIEYDLDGDGDLEPVIGNPLWGQPGTVYLSDILCNWYDLGELPNCNTRYGKISMHISDHSEAEWGMDYFPDDSPANDWPTNALQLDGAKFTIEFGLFQQPLPPGVQVYYPAP